MGINIYAEDWMFSMGMVGLKHILEDDVELTDFGLSFDLIVLEKLPEKYFAYMLKEFDVAERDYQFMKDKFKYAVTREERFKQGVSQIRSKMGDQYKKVERYFKGLPSEVGLKELIEDVKKIKKFDQAELLEKSIDEYYRIMKTQEINEKLTINFFKTVILQPLYGQPSFINVSKNALTKEEQVALFYEEYVKPVLLEGEFHNNLQTDQESDVIKEFLFTNKDYKPFNSIHKEIKKKITTKEIKQYIDDLPRCTFIDGLMATTNFEEKIFNPLGVIAPNFNWELEPKQAIPLSVLAKLILFLAPAGIAFYSRKDGFEEQGEYRSYAGFVMSDQPFTEIFRMNESFKTMKKGNNPFDEVVCTLLRDTQQRAKYITKQLFFLEIFSIYPGKKTILDYYHMPPYIAEYFQRYGDKLQAIYPRELREAFTRSLLKGIEPRDVTFRCLRYAIKENYSGVSGYIAAREMNRIQALKRGVGDMAKEDKRVYVVFKLGQELKNKLVTTSEKRAANTEVYTASGGKKINGIAYRLLNAAKAGSKKSFMDTLFRIHMTADQEISSIFLNVLHEENLTFEVISSAFIAGLLSEDYKEKVGVGNE